MSQSLELAPVNDDQIISDKLKTRFNDYEDLVPFYRLDPTTGEYELTPSRLEGFFDSDVKLPKVRKIGQSAIWGYMIEGKIKNDTGEEEFGFAFPMAIEEEDTYGLGFYKNSKSKN